MVKSQGKLVSMCMQKSQQHGPKVKVKKYIYNYIYA